MADPLEGLDTIDWAAVTHAYGPATDVPGLLRGLTDPDAGVRDAAVYELFGNIWHQGTVYPATPLAVPFLGRLLADPATPDRTAVAHLLACIADGRGYYQRHTAKEYPNPFKPSEVVRTGGGTPEQLATEADTVRQAVRPWLPLLAPFLDDSDELVREDIVRAFFRRRRFAAFAEPLLAARLSIEPDARVGRLIERALQRWSDPGS